MLLMILLVLESVFVHGFLIFSQIFQGIYDFNCIITPNGTSEEVVKPQEETTTEVKLWGLPNNGAAILDIPIPDFSTNSNYSDVEQIEPELEKYTPSVLSNEHLSFFDEIAEEVNPFQVDADLNEAADDILSMESWEKEPLPVTVSTVMAAVADARIVDYMLGEQRWVVEVVGEEQGYIHVSDGSGRAWIDANSFMTFGRGDIILVSVDRKTENQVDLIKSEMLQEYSMDFSMTEVIEYHYEESYVAEYESA